MEPVVRPQPRPSPPSSRCGRARPGALPRRRRLAAAAILLVACAAPALGQPVPTPTPTAAQDRACLECHAQAHVAALPLADRLLMTTGDPPPAGAPTDARPGLLVTAESLAGSVHAGVACVDCHRDVDRLPHARTLAPASCLACHADADAAFAASVHAAAAARGDPLAPRCQTCHGGHDIRPKSDRASTVHPLNAARICADCHRQHAGSATNGATHEALVADYLDSVHGHGVTSRGLVMAATCADCHGHHDTRAADDPLAHTARARIPETCGRCHLGVVEVFAESVHGRAVASGSDRAPVCTDCHAGHRITRASVPATHLDIVAECGDCHDRPELSGERRATFYDTYRRSYHGQVTELGGLRAARCSDCHGAHDVRRGDDPASRVNPANLVETCARCHPKANASFVRFDPHADYKDRARYPVLHGVWMYFIVVMSAAFGFFGLHSLLWFVRSGIERVRNGPKPRVAHATAIRRFTRINRINHALVILTFFGLVLTGIPLLFSHQAWARGLATALGGIAACGLFHRACAIVLGINFLLHFYSLAKSARLHRGPLRSWLLGPNTMLPVGKDLRDCAAMFRWFLRGGPTPRFGRWTYWEKFDYWAEVGGSGIIGGSGLLLWFPEFFARFLPGWIFNAAMIVHGYEALLALGFIFTIHFFNAHLRIDKFPVDDVIFTGSLAEDELRHERPDEYERLVAAGRLEALRVPAAPHWQHQAAVAVGIVAMLVGITLVTLIVLAGLGVL